MANPKYVEAIRLLVETSGDEELKALVAQLGSVEGASKETETALAAMLDELSDTQRLERAAEAYRDLGERVIGLNRDYNNARGKAEALAAEMASVEKPTKAQELAFSRARTELERLGRELAASRGKYSGIKAELEKAGVAGKTYADTLGRIAERQRTANASIKQFVTDTTNARKAAADLASRRADFTRFMGDGANAAEDAARALAQYQQRARAAAEENARLKKSANGVGSIFTGLRSALAGVGAYLGLREAAGGVINLLRVAAAAEDTKRALQNLYGGQEAGNRAFKALQSLATDSGLSFQALSDMAKKLKAFGLDPLNGSLKALVNQNAAVGGTQEDLEGKVLALGQAWAKQKLQGEEILQLMERSVPVWDLLEKATGKNRAELQKLSEDGKLGRDAIRALYEEIGKANAGAAQRGLAAISGLVAQASARWIEFLNKVADAGVTDYFKQQIQSLLGSTQNLDLLAKRVADGIVGTLEALRRFGAQLLPIATAVANFTLGLFKHAEALLFVGKVYAGLRIAQFAQQFATAAVSMQAATAATTALGGASAGAAGRVGMLGRALALLPKLLRISIVTFGIEASISLLTSLNGLMEERQKQLAQEERYGILQRQIQQELIASGQELTRVYGQYAAVAVQSGEQISRMTKAQAQDYTFALAQAQNYYRGLAVEAKAAGDAQAQAAAVKQFEALGTAIERAKQRLSDLGAEAEKQQALKTFVNAAVENFDKLASKGESVRKVVSGIFDGLDLASPRGAEQAIAIFDQISARGTVSAEAIRDELRSAIAGVADEDLPRLQKSAEDAMKAGTEGAQVFKEELERINLTRLDVDVDAIKTGFTRAGRAVVDQFKGSVREVEKLGLTAAQKSQAIATAFDNAFSKASTSVELEALKRALQDAVSAGSLGFSEFQQRIESVNGKLEQLANKGKQASTALSEGSKNAVEPLREVEDAANKAAASVEKIGEAGSAAASGVGDAAGAARSLSFSISGASEEFARLLLVQDNLSLGNQFRAQQIELFNAVAEAKRLNGEYDELAGRREALQKKFNLVDPQAVDELVQVEKQLEDSRKRRADEEKRRSDESLKKTQEALAETQRQEAERAQTGLQTVQVIRLEVAAVEGVAALLSNGGRLDPATSRKLAEALASPLLQVIGRARDGSNQPRRSTR